MHKIVFMGADPIALPLLEWLQQHLAAFDARLEAVFSQPDRPSGRGKKRQPNAISAWALQHGLTLFRPEKPDASTRDWLQQAGIDLVLVMAYGHMLRRSLLEVPPRGFINFHASLLPRLRGASPVESAVATGESESGVSLMRITAQMDAGAVCDRERVPIEHFETGGSLRKKLASACPALLERQLGALLNGTAVFAEQDASAATYCRKLEKADGALDFEQPARELAARINGLDPWPGCFCLHHGTRLKVRRASFQPHAEAVPGTVHGLSEGMLPVATGEGTLLVGMLQRPGGKMLPAEDFLRGYPLAEGSRLEGRPCRELVAPRPFHFNIEK